MTDDALVESSDEPSDEPPERDWNAPMPGDFVPFDDAALEDVDRGMPEDWKLTGAETDLLKSIRIKVWPGTEYADDLSHEDKPEECFVEICAFAYGEVGRHEPLVNLLKHEFDGGMYGKTSEIIALTKLRDECDRLIALLEALPDDEPDE